MYEFYFGDIEEILKNEKQYLIFIKRLLPRWANGIPDSEFMAIYDILKEKEGSQKPLVLAETGSGASSLVMLYFAIRSNGMLYSWDINGSKASFLKSVANETISKSLGVNIYNHWKFIEFTSTDPYLGIPILGELNVSVDFCFFDSWHTWDNLSSEIKLISPYLKDNAVVAIDDANYNNISYNYGFANIFRKKLGLPPIIEPASNKCRPYHEEAKDLLCLLFEDVEKIDDSYKMNHQDDIFFNYYGSDKQIMGEIGMEKNDERSHRFDAWLTKGYLSERFNKKGSI